MFQSPLLSSNILRWEEDILILNKLDHKHSRVQFVYGIDILVRPPRIPLYNFETLDNGLISMNHSEFKSIRLFAQQKQGFSQPKKLPTQCFLVHSKIMFLFPPPLSLLQSHNQPLCIILSSQCWCFWLQLPQLDHSLLNSHFPHLS